MNALTAIELRCTIKLRSPSGASLVIIHPIAESIHCLQARIHSIVESIHCPPGDIHPIPGSHSLSSGRDSLHSGVHSLSSRPAFTPSWSRFTVLQATSVPSRGRIHCPPGEIHSIAESIHCPTGAHSLHRGVDSLSSRRHSSSFTPSRRPFICSRIKFMSGASAGMPSADA